MKIRILDSYGGKLHKSYKEQLDNLNIKHYDIKGIYDTITTIDDFDLSMISMLLSLKQPKWLNDKSRQPVGSIVVSTPDNSDGDVDLVIIIYDGYLEGF